MPSFLNGYMNEPVTLIAGESSAYEPPHQPSFERSSLNSSSTTGTVMHGSGSDGHIGNKYIDGILSGGSFVVNSSLHSIPNGRSSGSTYSRERGHSRNGSAYSIGSGLGASGDSERWSPASVNGVSKRGVMEHTGPPVPGNSTATQTAKPKSPEPNTPANNERTSHARQHSASAPPSDYHEPSSNSDAATAMPATVARLPRDETATAPINRFSSPPNFIPPISPGALSSTLSHPRLQHRHTLQVPRVSTSRTSRDFSFSNANTSEDGLANSGRFSPTTAGGRRASLTLGRRTTRSNHSDLHLDDILADGDVARWTETIRQKRASRRKRKEEEEEDDRVVVGTKVDMHHVNWVTAYNMLTGIRFTVSRTNAKLDRELTDGDFDARHKFSFDITGNELTPSAKYDFKFKDYAPLVFRHLRAKFKLDPADYLMSLTSKYILSELGSPGKSGSFFYFSRDYKYIIKTIHQSEHKLLRKILREYYTHIERYPNTLISQFYGLHRVKIPYGRKIHFVVMNNLFPPHRDIHETFDLKGSTIGRDYKEEDLDRNPRATLKDLNWLRRNLHIELGHEKKHMFVQQMERDVALLQKLKIMDYSLLVGIHDLNRGNEEKLRNKTLQVFQPGAERGEEPQLNMLTRTPSKVESARNARELRQVIKREKPVPMDKSTSKMPDEMLEERKDFVFYSDDGGFRATHEDGRPGEEIYYLGIIDCLTHYGVVKKAEHLWKGLSNNKALISPIPPESYGDRFIKFITGITMTREEAEREIRSNDQLDGSIHTQRTSSHYLSRGSAERTMDKAERQARKSEQGGASEANVPDRCILAVRSPSAERTNGLAGATLPVVEEVGESGSTGGRSGRSRDEGVKPNELRDGNNYGPSAVSDGQQMSIPTEDAAIRYTKPPPLTIPPPRLTDSPLQMNP